MTTPRDQGFAMPPEWAPHERCWMAWPCRPELWGEHMPAARQAYVEIAQAIAQFEPVTMIARPDLTAEASLQCGQGISILPLDHDDSWLRDTGPTFVRDPSGQLAGIDWRFDGYGRRIASVRERRPPRSGDLRAPADPALRGAPRARGQRSARRRRGHLPGLRRLGARSEAQSGPRARRRRRWRSPIISA